MLGCRTGHPTRRKRAFASLTKAKSPSGAGAGDWDPRGVSGGGGAVSVSEDGKYTATDSEITSTGFTDAEATLIVTGFQGTTVTGLTTPPIDWTYESVLC